MSSGGDGRSTMRLYNNVLYCTDKKFDITLPDGTTAENNVFVGTGDSRLPTAGTTWRWNAFQGVPRPTSNGITGDPQFVAPGTGGDSIDSADGYRLKKSSPLLANGGIVAGNGGRDFWATPVPQTSKPNRGAYEGPGL